MLIAYVLWLFLGVFGAHRFYLRRVKTGLAFVILFVLFFAIVALFAAAYSSVISSSSDISEFVSSPIFWVFSIGRLVVLIAWLGWYAVDLFLIAVMVKRDQRRLALLKEADVEKVFE